MDVYMVAKVVLAHDEVHVVNVNEDKTYGIQVFWLQNWIYSVSMAMNNTNNTQLNLGTI